MHCNFFILLTHEGSHREVYQEFQPSCDILSYKPECKGAAAYQLGNTISHMITEVKKH